MTDASVAPAVVAAALGADLDALDDAELAVVLHDAALWLRPAQIVPPPGSWRSFLFVAGRGAGKTFGLAYDLNRGVEAGDITKPGLVAPTEDDIAKIQIAALVDTAPPWFRPEPYRGGVRWPNGVVALAGTANVKRPLSGVNTDYLWLTELVKWPENTRRAAFNDVTTTCRVGRFPRYVIDTTSQGVNELILDELDAAEANPEAHIVRRGTIFDNPYLSRDYLVAEIRKYGWHTRSADEELLGLVFRQTAGALWEQSWLDDHRRAVPPANPDLVLLAWDPALSDAPTADEQGLCQASRAFDEVYVTDDYSARMTPGDAAEIVIRECERGAAGVVVETNHAGVMPRQLLEAKARARGMRVEVVPREAAFPNRRAGVVFVKEYHTPDSKSHRATAPAALYQAGRAHHVGAFPQLEREQVTWEPGSRRSPNRLDACAYSVAELGGIAAPRRDGRADVAESADAHTTLKAKLRGVTIGGRGRGRLGV